MISGGIGEELDALIAFLCTREPGCFRRVSDDMLEITSPREAIILASVVRDSFFITSDDSGNPQEFHVELPRELAGRWATDLYREHPETFHGSKLVRFFRHWVPVAGYSGKGADYRTRRRVQEMDRSLAKEISKQGKDPSDVLFIPYFGYSSRTGYQFGESIYHYIAGLAFKDRGYVVIDEYAPSILTGTARTPDLSAFRTPELVELMKALRAKGIVSTGAFLQELQLYSIFGKQTTKKKEERPSPIWSKDLTDAEAVVIEVKRSDGQHMVDAGSRQLASYASEAYGLYDEAYLAAPFVTGPGTISLDRGGGLHVVRPPPGTSPAITDFWKERRAWQLLDVRLNVVLQVLKNTGLSSMVDVCGGKESVRTYEELQESLGSLDIEEAIRRL